MDVTLRRIPATDVGRGFEHVVSGFSGEGEDGDRECCLGREWVALEKVLIPLGEDGMGELAVRFGDLLGDDDLGTACLYLPPGEVVLVSHFLKPLDFEKAVADQAGGLAASFRGGRIPDGYHESLVSCLHRLRDLYAEAGRAGEGVAKLIEA